MASKSAHTQRSPLAQWLRRVRLQLDLKQEIFADQIGISRPYLSNMERGGAPIGPDTVAAVLSAFPEITPPSTGDDIQVTGRAVGDDRLAYIRYAGVVPAGNWGDPLLVTDTRAIEPKFAGKNRFLCTVVGDSCYPCLQSGDLTIWEAEVGEPYGLIVIGQREDDHAVTVKELQRDGNGPHLVPINNDFDEVTAAEGYRIVAFLVGVIRPGDVERTWYNPGGLRKQQLV